MRNTEAPLLFSRKYNTACGTSQEGILFYCGKHDGFYRMFSVFCLIPGSALGTIDHILGDLFALYRWQTV
jgi:hypothetical protein